MQVAARLSKDALQGGVDDYDPLDAFMAGVQREVVANKPTNRARPGLELDEADHVADYMEQQQAREAAIGEAFLIFIPWRKLVFGILEPCILKFLLDQRMAAAFP